MFQFPRGLQICTSHFCFTFLSKRRVSAKSTPLCFRCPVIGSCSVLPLAAPDLAWCAKGMQLPEEFPHLLAPFLISLSPTDPGSHYPSPLIVLHDNWLLLHLMYFITRHTERDRRTDAETFQGRQRRRVGGLCGAPSQNRTRFILVFLSPDSLLASHFMLPVRVLSPQRWRISASVSVRSAVHARVGCLRWSAYSGLDD